MNASILWSGSYDFWLVALSVLIACFASYVALDLVGRIYQSSGITRKFWLIAGAIGMGSGIWAMHYVGMEAFRLPVEVLYDLPTVGLSLSAAVLASGGALFIASQRKMDTFALVGGSISMGGGIAATHYTGMDAMRIPAICIYDPWLVTLSVCLAILISFVALKLTFRSHHDPSFISWRKVLTSLVMGMAVSSMHYVGMAAVRFRPGAMMHGGSSHAVNISSLGQLSVAIVASLILVIILLTSQVDRRFALKAQEVVESRLQLQAIFANLVEGLIVQDRNLVILRLNNAARQIFDLFEDLPSYERILQKFQFSSMEGVPISAERWPGALAAKGEFMETTELKLRDLHTAKQLILAVRTAPIFGADGHAEQILTSYHDITELRKVDEARSRLAAIVESSQDAIISKNEMGIVTSWNRGAQNIFGYSAAEMIGESIKRLLPTGEEQEEEEFLRRIRRGESIEHIERIRQRKDGQLISVSLMISPILDAEGKVIGASKIGRDITARKELERQLQQSQKLDAIGQLMGGVAHDFNNLLGIIIGNLDLFERELSRDGGPPKRIATAQRAASRGADLTRRLLAFSSNQELRPAPTSLSDSIQNMIAMSARIIGPDITISTECDQSLPLLSVDPARLESALVNLVVNARDAMPNGGNLTLKSESRVLELNSPLVMVGDLKFGTYAFVSVSDTGHGMARETLDRIFEPFFTTKPAGKGTGLGLAMVYGFVKQSGGMTYVESEQGRGTTVSFYLPITEQENSQSVAPRERNGNADTHALVLVVDDEDDLLEIASAYLRDLGYLDIQAHSGAMALEILTKRTDIELMVTDIIMPGGMNGVELGHRARALNPNLKVIYSSGFPADALAERSGNVTHEGPMLHKPYQRDEFIAAVQHAMSATSTGTT